MRVLWSNLFHLCGFGILGVALVIFLYDLGYNYHLSSQDTTTASFHSPNSPTLPLPLSKTGSLSASTEHEQVIGASSSYQGNHPESWIVKPAICSANNETLSCLQSSPSSTSSQTNTINDPVCKMNKCPLHSFCFLGACPCHPGYTGKDCQDRIPYEKSNPWYTLHCPNLKMTLTFDINLPLDKVGGEKMSVRHKNKTIETSTLRHNNPVQQQDEGQQISPAKESALCPPPANPDYCSYLCFSHASYGSAVVPLSLWKSAQQAEGDLWHEVSSWQTGADSNDRSEEHWVAFDMFRCIEKGKNLGTVIEVGAGPWTQLKGMLHIRPDIQVQSFTVWEPGANRYIREVSSCSYKVPGKLAKFNGNGFHSFPVTINSQGGELLADTSSHDTYDTLISINVIEHVQDAFSYLTGLYLVLKKGGTLIMHERYYSDDQITNADKFHPVRIKREVLDRFLGGFRIIYNNCNSKFDNRPGEKGYYVIAIKK